MNKININKINITDCSILESVRKIFTGLSKCGIDIAS